MPKMLNTETGPKFIKSKAEVGSVFERWRKQKGLTKTDFSKALGLTPHYYHYIEAGKYYPNYPTLSIARQIGLDILELFDLTTKELRSLRKGRG
jgi:transcriptional regulator with XRE-family HTH domain